MDTSISRPSNNTKQQESSLVEAVNKALYDIMAEDSSTIIIGEDIADNGGVFRATDNLLNAYGSNRVINSPLAESMLAGLGVGMSAMGLKPIIEIQFMGFIYPALNQIISHVSRLRNRTRGRLSCPMVIRAPYGGGIHAPEHHSESTEAIFAHIPGVRVVVPSTPERAYGLLLSAVDNPDPVIFLEPKRVYRKFKQALPKTGHRLPLDKAWLEQTGDDLTIVSWGAMMVECQIVCMQLQDEGIGVDLIDLATISPFDRPTIIQSVKKTGRCLIVHEAAKTCGVGAEIAAEISTHAFSDLKAPIRRVTGYDTIMPFFQLEQHYMPSVERILQGARDILAWNN